MTDFINNGTANQLKIGKAVVYVISDWQMVGSVFFFSILKRVFLNEGL